MPAKRLVITYDASAITEVDEVALETLARLLLAARRHGASIELRNAPPLLRDLLAVVGLADELALEVHGHAEEREQIGIDEEVDPGDPAA